MTFRRSKRSLLWARTAFVGMALLIGAVPGQASAATLWCTVSVTNVAITPAGLVMAHFDGMGWPVICDLNNSVTTSVGPITPETCRGQLAMLMTAKSTGQKFTLAIDYGSSTPPASCGAVQNFSWQLPNPYPYWLHLGN